MKTPEITTPAYEIIKTLMASPPDRNRRIVTFDVRPGGAWRDVATFNARLEVWTPQMERELQACVETLNGLCKTCGLPSGDLRPGTADSDINVLAEPFCGTCGRNKYGVRQS